MAPIRQRRQLCSRSGRQQRPPAADRKTEDGARLQILRRCSSYLYTRRGTPSGPPAAGPLRLALLSPIQQRPPGSAGRVSGSVSGSRSGRRARCSFRNNIICRTFAAAPPLRLQQTGRLASRSPAAPAADPEDKRPPASSPPGALAPSGSYSGSAAAWAATPSGSRSAAGALRLRRRLPGG